MVVDLLQGVQNVHVYGFCVTAPSQSFAHFEFLWSCCSCTCLCSPILCVLHLNPLNRVFLIKTRPLPTQIYKKKNPVMKPVEPTVCLEWLACVWYLRWWITGWLECHFLYYCPSFYGNSCNLTQEDYTCIIFILQLTGTYLSQYDALDKLK